MTTSEMSVLHETYLIPFKKAPHSLYLKVCAFSNFYIVILYIKMIKNSIKTDGVHRYML